MKLPLLLSANQTGRRKLYLSLFKHHTINTYGGGEIQLHAFLNLLENW